MGFAIGIWTGARPFALSCQPCPNQRQDDHDERSEAHAGRGPLKKVPYIELIEYQHCAPPYGGPNANALSFVDDRLNGVHLSGVYQYISRYYHMTLRHT